MDLSLTKTEIKYLQKLCSNSRGDSPNDLLLLFMSKNKEGEQIIDQKEYIYRLAPNAIFQYLEYIELQEARKNAKQAKTYSITAIIIALLIGLAQVILNIKFLQMSP